MSTVKRSTTRLTRSDRIAKRLRNVESDSAFDVKKAEYTVRVHNMVPVEVQGFLLAVSDDSVLIRHKRTNASKRMVISRFSNNSVVEVFGSIGEVSAVTVLRETVTNEYVGTIASSANGVVTIKTQSGELVRITEANCSRLEISAEDVEGTGKKKKSKKSVKEKEVKVKKKKSKRRDDLDDDLDD